jgi:hypothetical protein
MRLLIMASAGRAFVVCHGRTAMSDNLIRPMSWRGIKCLAQIYCPAIYHSAKREYSRFQELRSIVKHRPRATIPRKLQRGFTMDGTLPILYQYRDGSQTASLRYSSEVIAATRSRIGRRELGHYGKVDAWLYEALDKYPLNGLAVAVMGSADQGFGPWYECICLEYGAEPTTIDYNTVDFMDAKIQFLKAPIKFPSPEFDAALSISSFEHDGLGRYGDPLDPDADLKAMNRMKKTIKPGGLLYLTVPVGIDKVVFNVHRIYGRKRLPCLLRDWTIIDTFGLEDNLLDRDTGYGWEPMQFVSTVRGLAVEPLHPEYPEYAPVWVLRND